MKVYWEGQRILERQKFQFPGQWLHVDSIQNQVNSLQVKIVVDKPVEGALRPDEACGSWPSSSPSTPGSRRRGTT